MPEQFRGERRVVAIKTMQSCLPRSVFGGLDDTQHEMPALQQEAKNSCEKIQGVYDDSQDGLK